MLLLITLTLLVVTLLTVGVTLSLLDVDKYNFALYLILLGVLALCAVAALWLAKPGLLTRWPRCCRRLCPWCFRPKKYKVPETRVVLDPTNAETVMRSIHGIPYLMQAIQYSMETTYFSDMMSQMGNGPVQASVIHAAPGCRSVLDSDTESECNCCCGDDQTPSVFVDKPPVSPRTSLPDEQWEKADSRWSNAQLRLDVTRRQSYLPVFPLSEGASSANRLAQLRQGYAAQSLDRLNQDAETETYSQRDDENVNLLKVGETIIRKSSSATMIHQCRRKSSASCRAAAPCSSNSNDIPIQNQYKPNVQVMRMGMNGVFLHKFNASFRK